MPAICIKYTTMENSIAPKTEEHLKSLSFLFLNATQGLPFSFLRLCTDSSKQIIFPVVISYVLFIKRLPNGNYFPLLTTSINVSYQKNPRQWKSQKIPGKQIQNLNKIFPQKKSFSAVASNFILLDEIALPSQSLWFHLGQYDVTQLLHSFS